MYGHMEDNNTEEDVQSHVGYSCEQSGVDTAHRLSSFPLNELSWDCSILSPLSSYPGYPGIIPACCRQQHAARCQPRPPPLSYHPDNPGIILLCCSSYDQSCPAHYPLILVILGLFHPVADSNMLPIVNPAHFRYLIILTIPG